MIVINKSLTKIILACICFVSFGQAQRIDRAATELDHTSNLFKWSDLIVIAIKDELGRGITVEEFIQNKRTDIHSNSVIELGHLIEYDHISPLVMRGYRYLFFLTVLDAKTETTEDKNKIVCKIAAGGNGVVALFNLDDLEDHPRVLRMKRITPNYNLIKDFKNELQKNFGTIDGELIKEAVERVVALYAEADPKAQAEQLIESLREGNPAMIRLSRELLQSIDLDAID